MKSPKRIHTLLIASLIALAGTQAYGTSKSFEDFKTIAAANNRELTTIEIIKAPKELEKRINEALTEASEAGDTIAAVGPSAVSFENTILAIDDLWHQLGLNIGPLYLYKETSPIAEIRDAGTAAVKAYQDWSISFIYREDIFQSIKAFAESGQAEELQGEDLRLFEDVWSNYQRRGFTLPKAEREQLEAMKKELAAWQTTFSDNIRKSSAPIRYTASELEGVPESFLEGFEAVDGIYTLDGNITFHASAVYDHAKKPEARMRMWSARLNRARSENVDLLKEIVIRRNEIATLLGHDSWADHVTENRMAGNEATVREFLTEVGEGLQPKFDAENIELTELKRELTGDPDAILHDWDRFYYRNQLKKSKYAVDTEELRRYFSYEQSLWGMFKIYEEIFGLKVQALPDVETWEESVEAYALLDAESEIPLGLFYLDMFPREGKFNHFASFGTIDGKLLSNGNYQAPINVLVCNFTPPTKSRPSLLSYDEVETLFHEFGHLLHAVLTTAKHYAFSGTSVPRDFVEAPSQVLEFWLEDKAVLDRFAADYEDPTKKIPAETLANLVAANQSTVANMYRRQVTFAKIDLELHSSLENPDELDVLGLSNQVWNKYIGTPELDTAFVANFGHLMGYDAGYYGYMWSEVIAADVARVFRDSPGGYLNQDLGMKLRREIFEVGDSRDVNESTRAFLKREVSKAPFLESLGVEPKS